MVGDHTFNMYSKCKWPNPIKWKPDIGRMAFLKTYAVCKTLPIMAELVRQMKKDHKRSTMYAIAFKLDRPHKVKGRATDISSNQTIYSHKRVSSQRIYRCVQWAPALQSSKQGSRDGAVDRRHVPSSLATCTGKGLDSYKKTSDLLIHACEHVHAH